ncbi:toxin-antitoxin system YwqK family antitoxin [Jejudonia soesokkakensis]|uniref:Toxin-antitoxin system YwqK family antitoxin n=1 Tax=Jejudonia soesokkakensis TaxID=1323432 RepID=A0ABW2MSF7_9FLAO
MKKVLILIAIVFCVNSVFSQDSPKDTFEKKGNLIEATLYHDNGEISQTGYYTLANKLQGEWISYDAQGNKTAVANYNKGLKVGTWKFFDGNEIKEVVYSNARIAKVSTYEVKDVRVVSNR